MKKTVFITGASRGIGEQTARSLAEQGHIVIAAARSHKKLKKLAAPFPDNIYPIKLDITIEDSSKKVIELLESKNLRLDAIIHNAGLLINKPFEDQTLDDWQSQLNVNILGPVMLTKNLLPFLNKSSHVLNISSMGGYQGSSKFPGLSAYSVSKGALSILTECLAVELAESDIACNCLCLGAVQTEMLEEAFPGMKAPVSSESMGDYIANFSINGHSFYNGKVLPVSLVDPS